MKINEFIQQNYQEYIEDVETWVDMQYDGSFKDCFDKVRSIHKNMKSKQRKISDTELEWILTELPMELFSISEKLNKLRLDVEVIKLRKKTVRKDLERDAAEDIKEKIITRADSKIWIDAELAAHDVVISAYQSLITRVESEISFSRELIMGCKKIWDARRKTESSNPVDEVVTNNGENLPSYYNSDRYREPYIR